MEYFDRVVREFPGGKMANAAIDVEANCYIALGDLVKAATCRERLLAPPYSNGLGNAKRYEIVKKIADSLFAAGKWREGEKWFKLKLEGAKDPEDKVSAASALIQAATNLKKFDDLKNYLKYMSIDTVSRSDLGLNMALLQAGDKLVEQKRYSEASALYSMVFGRDKILKNLTSYVDKTKKRVELMKRINPTNPQIAELDNKLKSIEFSIGKINDDVSDYTADLMLRSSRNYMLTNRDYESFWSYMQLLDPKFKDHSAREDFFYAAIIGAYKIGKTRRCTSSARSTSKTFRTGSITTTPSCASPSIGSARKTIPNFSPSPESSSKNIPTNPRIRTTSCFSWAARGSKPKTTRSLSRPIPNMSRISRIPAYPTACSIGSEWAIWRTATSRTPAKLSARLPKTIPSAPTPKTPDTGRAWPSSA